ncbi:MAG: glycosyl hydrolase family 53 [Oscillospiraceae bacterium]|nr:glycosyl hydrolase family 53 [Oscillospiraceae bacterium]
MDIKGFTYGYNAGKGMFTKPEADESMEALASLGGNWVCLVITVYQEHFYSTSFGFDYRRTATDKELCRAIDKLKSLGLKVCLKPLLNSADGTWRANIGFPEADCGDVDYWKEWFSCYNAFICHYAEIAEDKGCEMLCVGCEMLGTERKEDYWRSLIADVRKIYGGELVYNANHGKERNIKWFDAVDYIGTSAYYPVAETPGESLENMCMAWKKTKQQLREISEENGGKKIIFMEIGCRSARGCAMMPWDFTHKDFPYDEDEQANFYESALKTMSDEEWFGGFFWWDWYTFIPKQKNERGFSIYGKKAENIVREWYKNR